MESLNQCMKYEETASGSSAEFKELNQDYIWHLTEDLPRFFNNFVTKAEFQIKVQVLVEKKKKIFMRKVTKPETA